MEYLYIKLTIHEVKNFIVRNDMGSIMIFSHINGTVNETFNVFHILFYSLSLNYKDC